MNLDICACLQKKKIVRLFSASSNLEIQRLGNLVQYFARASFDIAFLPAKSQFSQLLITPYHHP